MERLSLVLRRLRRAVLARRRLLAGLAAGVAVAAGLQAAAEPPPPRTWVLTAAHDIAGGAVLGEDDLTRVAFAPASVPDGVITERAAALGRTTATPVRAGEPLTDVRLVSGSMLSGFPGTVAAPVRIGDAGAVALLEVGDRIDVLSADPRGRSDALVVASGVPVIAIPRQDAQSSALAPGGLIVVAVPSSTAVALASAGVSGYLSVVITQ